MVLPNCLPPQLITSSQMLPLLQQTWNQPFQPLPLPLLLSPSPSLLPTTLTSPLFYAAFCIVQLYPPSLSLSSQTHKHTQLLMPSPNLISPLMRVLINASTSFSNSFTPVYPSNPNYPLLMLASSSILCYPNLSTSPSTSPHTTLASPVVAPLSSQQRAPLTSNSMHSFTRHLSIPYSQSISLLSILLILSVPTATAARQCAVKHSSQTGLPFLLSF